MAISPLYSEMGHAGDLKSLAGVIGQAGKGRQIQSTSLVCTSAPAIILSANPKRIAALIQNTDDPSHLGTNITVYLGGSGAIPKVLLPQGSIQIDELLPWIGEVWVAAPTNSPVVVVDEVTVT